MRILSNDKSLATFSLWEDDANDVDWGIYDYEIMDECFGTTVVRMCLVCFVLCSEILSGTSAHEDFIQSFRLSGNVRLVSHCLLLKGVM